jgi:cell division protease FtsH
VLRFLRRPAPHGDERPRQPFGLPQGRAALAAFGLAFVAAIALSIAWPDTQPERASLSEVLEALDDGVVERIILDDASRTARLKLEDGTVVRGAYPADFGPELVDAARRADVEVLAEPAKRPALGEQLLVALLPLALLLVFVSRMMRGRFGIGNFSGGRGEQAPVPETRFTDVAGAAEATSELREIVEYLTDPDRYTRVGARPPRGVLLVGPPGTGKTLLARAVAGEAGVPFFSISGSDFTEVFVGVGAGRVRKLFDKARAAGRAIVFIDEIDAVGKRRSSSPNGATDEREQTLNQLLVELDGFSASQIVVLAATNRPDTLDPALTRPGRFDRRIVVGAPDRAGREEILALYLAGKPIDDGIDVPALARRTPGFTGADLANLANQAALAAAREGVDLIRQDHFADAVATVLLGRERRSAQVLELDRRITAWHEAGHTVAALVHPHADDPAGVSIVPRGHAGGVTWMDGNDHQFLTAPQARARLVVSMAGRAAEQLVFGAEYTQGAGGDLQAATDLATKMAADYGMSPVVGAMHIPEDQRQFGENANLLQRAVRELLEDALSEARVLIEGNRALLTAVAEQLLEDETLDAADLEAIRLNVGDGEVTAKD